MSNVKKNVLSIRVDDDLHAQILALAADRDWSMAHAVSWILAQYFAGARKRGK